MSAGSALLRKIASIFAKPPVFRPRLAKARRCVPAALPLHRTGRTPHVAGGRAERCRAAFPVFVAVVTTLSACSIATPIRYAFDSARDPPERLRIDAPDGTDLVLYSVAIGDGAAPIRPKRMLFVSGSGCTSLGRFLRPYLAPIRAPHRVFAVEKPGIAEGDLGFACSDAFHAADILPAILARQRAALDWLRRGGDGGSGPVTLFGVSEGGSVAVALAAEAGPAIVDRVIVVGSGGLPLRRSLQILASRDRLPIDVEALFSEVASDPHAVSRRRLGHAHAYWSSMLDADPLPAYLRLQVPTLVLFGEQDRSVPVESAWHLREALRIAGRRNVTVGIVPGADHTLHRDGQDLKASLFRYASEGLRSGVWAGEPMPEHDAGP